MVLSFVLYDSGDFKSAQKNAEKAIELSQKNNLIFLEALSKISLGRIIGRTNVSQIILMQNNRRHRALRDGSLHHRTGVAVRQR